MITFDSKTEMASLDIKFIVTELKKKLEGGIIKKI